MKKLFKAIRQGDSNEVVAILAKNPEAISSISSPPPKKDIGQSPLQVAVKIGEFDIAYYLMEQGADFAEWANHGHYAGEGETNRELFLDEFAAQPDSVRELTLRGRTSSVVVKGDEDQTAHTRKVMREYCRKHNLL